MLPESIIMCIRCHTFHRIRYSIAGSVSKLSSIFKTHLVWVCFFVFFPMCYMDYVKLCISWLLLQQWASLYQPLTFNCELSLADPAGDLYLNKLDPSKAFKGKAKVPAPKKKQSTQCNSGGAAKGQSNAGRQSGAKR